MGGKRKTTEQLIVGHVDKIGAHLAALRKQRWADLEGASTTELEQHNQLFESVSAALKTLRSLCGQSEQVKAKKPAADTAK
jgi:hypothetical protein